MLWLSGNALCMMVQRLMGEQGIALSCIKSVVALHTAMSWNASSGLLFGCILSIPFTGPCNPNTLGSNAS